MNCKRFFATLPLSFWAVMPAFAQAMAPPDLRVIHGQLQLVLTNGVPAHAHLALTLRDWVHSQPLPPSEGGGLVVVPLQLTTESLGQTLPDGGRLEVALTGPTLTARWSVEPLKISGLPMKSYSVGDTQSTGALDSAKSGLVADLNFAGMGNNYVPFRLALPLPGDTIAVGALQQIDHTAASHPHPSFRVKDSRGEYFGYFLPPDEAADLQISSHRLAAFDYRFGAPTPAADPNAPPVGPMSLDTLLFESNQRGEKGKSQALLPGLFVIRRTAFQQTEAPASLSQISVDFASHVPMVHSMVGFLHAANATQPEDQWIIPLNPALWRVGYLWMDNRDRLKRLGVPTVLILGDLSGPKMPKSVREWKTRIHTITQERAGRGLLWDIWNEPDGAFFWKGTQEQFFETYGQAAEGLRSELGPQTRISGPSISGYDSRYLTRFLDYCQAHSVRVNVLSWHELGVDGDIPSVEEHLRDARTRFFDNPKYRSVGLQEIQINEIVGPSAQYRPGEILGYFHALEAGGASGACKGCWDNNCGNATLDGILTPDTHQPRAAWWAYKTYADTVHGRVVSSSSDRRLAPFASVSGQKATILVGCFADEQYSTAPVPIRLRLSHLSGLSLLHTRRVSLKIEKIPDTGEQAVPILPIIQAQTAAVVNGELALILPPLAVHEAYVVTAGN